jgi:hypothetical protein
MAEKFDVNSFIAEAKAARAEALVKQEAAKKAAEQKKADTEAARGIQNQANNKFQYADALENSLKQFEGQLRIFGTKISRGDVLSTIEQRDFDRAVSEYKKVSSAYNKAVAQGNAILAKMPESFAKEKKETQAKAGVVEEPAAAQAGPVSLTDFLKSAVGNVEKTKKLQQALKDAGTYKGPVNGILNADVLLPAAELAEEKLDRYASLGITFTDRFEGYSRLASTKGGDGTGGPSVTQYPAISSETDALSTINAVFNAEVGRDATPSEFKIFAPKLMAAQRKNPSTQTVRTVNGKKIVETVTGLDPKQFLVTEIQKNPATKAEIAMRLKSAQSLNRQDLEKTARANGLDLDKNFGTVVDTWVKRVDNGEDIDIFKNIIRGTAKIGLPDKVSGLLDTGVDLETVYSPYKRLMASTLEVSPDSISLDDSTLRMAIGPDKEMSLYDFQRSLRKDPRWQYTDQARKSVSDAALGVLRDFGFTG